MAVAMFRLSSALGRWCVAIAALFGLTAVDCAWTQPPTLDGDITALLQYRKREFAARAAATGDFVVAGDENFVHDTVEPLTTLLAPRGMKTSEWLFEMAHPDVFPETRHGVVGHLHELLDGAGLLGAVPRDMSPTLLAVPGSDVEKLLDEMNDTSVWRSASLAETDLGYPLTVLETMLWMSGKLPKPFDWPRDSVQGSLFVRFFEILASDGIFSGAARKWYEKVLKYSENHNAPVDAGWMSSAVGEVLSYTDGKGVHAYRKVPRNARGEYDASYATHKLPSHKPLVIGLLADWASGTDGPRRVLEELKKQNPDVIVHLGDTYYSGTDGEATEYWLRQMRDTFGDKIVLQVPGNHDYYSSGGKPFFSVIDRVGHQEASFFVYRGKHWQLLGIDTSILDNNNLQTTMTFLPEDQANWTRRQLEIGKQRGLKTILVSHHQAFTRSAQIGLANGAASEKTYIPDQIAGTFPPLTMFQVTSEQLPGHLPPNAHPTVNTRLMSQLPSDLLEGVAVWLWGHEHTSALFEPYAGVRRARLIGNGCMNTPKDVDAYAEHADAVGDPWGGYPTVSDDAKQHTGDRFWSLGFATITLDGEGGHARYFELLDSTQADGYPSWGDATQYFEEDL